MILAYACEDCGLIMHRVAEINGCEVWACQTPKCPTVNLMKAYAPSSKAVPRVEIVDDER